MIIFYFIFEVLFGIITLIVGLFGLVGGVMTCWKVLVVGSPINWSEAAVYIVSILFLQTNATRIQQGTLEAKIETLDQKIEGLIQFFEHISGGLSIDPRPAGRSVQEDAIDKGQQN